MTATTDELLNSRKKGVNDNAGSLKTGAWVQIVTENNPYMLCFKLGDYVLARPYSDVRELEIIKGNVHIRLGSRIVILSGHDLMPVFDALRRHKCAVISPTDKSENRTGEPFIENITITSNEDETL